MTIRTEDEHGQPRQEPAALMHVYAEVWPIAVDGGGGPGIWLLSGDGPWPTLPIEAGSEPHLAVELELLQHGAYSPEGLMHSTSWRPDGDALAVTYLVVVPCSGPVRERWPSARPVSVRWAEKMGPAPTHGPMEPPAPRHGHVLIHGLGHLRERHGKDATIAKRLDQLGVTPHLEPFEMTIAQMYAQEHVGETIAWLVYQEHEPE
jgi:hypothetical protein